MFSWFFVDRPIFASVLSIVVALAGALALATLPVSQYPEITPPQVQISISYPGASARVVADTVAAPIEQQVNGVEGMLYMSSQSGNDGSYTLSVTFDVGTDLNTALVMVQNRVTLALPQLPSEVQRQGITVRKKTPDLLQIINFYSPDDRYDTIYLSNFALINVRDEILRVEGVSDINISGQRDYSIRVWLDPDLLAARNLTAPDVVAAIRSQNLEVAPGRIGAPPGSLGVDFQLPLDTLGRLTTPEQFGDIIVKTTPASRTPAFAPSPARIAGPNPKPLAASPLLARSNLPSLRDRLAEAFGAGAAGSTAGSGSTSSSAATGLAAMTGAANSTASTMSRSSTNPATTISTNANAAGPATSPASDSSPLAGLTTGAANLIKSAALAEPTETGGSDDPGASLATLEELSAAAGPFAGAAPAPLASGGMVGPVSLAGGELASGPWPAAAVVRLRDVARIELGARSYNDGTLLDGRPAVGMMIRLLPGSNALECGDRVRAKMEELRARFPEGVDFEISYDTTPFIRESVSDVILTLIEAIALVALVVLVFLQSWRAAIIPLVAVPVGVLGTFAVMAALGFSLNNISLFGLVLAIGIIVDDAIVVVENVQRWLDEGMPPREAARKAMSEVTGPIIAIAVVLCAVFVPCAFISGLTGRFFRQFAVTIAASTILSAFNSLTLSPALAAIVMRKHGASRDLPTRAIDFFLGWIFRGFNRGFDASARGYVAAVGRILRFSLFVPVLYLGLVGLTAWTFNAAPKGFIPEQDMGRLIVSVQLPDSAALSRTNEVLARVSEIAKKTPGVAHVTTTSGMSLALGVNSPNFGTAFIVLDPFSQRQDLRLRANAILAKLRREFASIVDADVKVMSSAPIPGLSIAGGFKVMIEDRGGAGLAALQARTDEMVARLREDPRIVSPLTQFRSRTPQLYLETDRIKAKSLGVPLDALNQTMQIDMGSVYANSFNQFGRYWQVTVQADSRFRSRPSDVDRFQVRGADGGMIPFGTLVRINEINGPVSVTRYNLYASAAITGNVVPGLSNSDAIAAVEAAAEGILPRSMAADWTEIYYLQIRAGNTAIWVFLLAVVCVFLALAALYESWSLPLAVILVVPLCLLCSIVGVWISGKSVDIFVQIGFIVLVGLACKNAILIVEFAHLLRRQGVSRRDAVLEAGRLRIRPILMTSFAFILGVLPLVLASGAGAEMRRSLGIAVFYGMLGVTLFGIFMTPLFFDLIDRIASIAAFKTRLARWGGSSLVGAIVGGAAALSLAKITGAEWREPVIIGVLAGALLALILPSLWFRVTDRNRSRRDPK